MRAHLHRVVVVVVLLVAVAACDRVAAVRRPPALSVYPTATSVRMFVKSDFEIRGGQPVYRERWMNPPGGYRLSADQARRFRNAIVVVPEHPVAACFIPHHFFRFYDAGGRQVGEIAVCFCCGGVQATPDFRLPAGQVLGWNDNVVGAIVKEFGAPTDIDCDD